MATAAERKHAERVLTAFPSLAPHLLEHAKPTAAVHAWNRGADGERIVGRKLNIAAQNGKCVVLHDLSMPGGGNIDHLVIGPRRITVVDAKHYRGATVGKRNDNGKEILTINDDDVDHLVDGIRRQRAAVQDALEDEPLLADNVFMAMAFIEAYLGFFNFVQVRGVWCGSVKESLSFALYSGPVLYRDAIKLDQDERARVAAKLAAAFPSRR